ncbi:Glycopeptide NRPS [Claviceps spartinae]|nr:Glycopeptide NRPS [Claviceps spartinae]
MSEGTSSELESVTLAHHGKAPTSAGDIITDDDLQLIWKWNGSVPAAFHGCVHDVITKRVQIQPDAQAICAWDGDWSYRQIDELSTNLAHRLKSKWTPVAMLGVMKAGGASVALEPALPRDRLQRIVDQAKPKLMLCSSLTEDLARQLTTQPILVVDELIFQPVGISRLPIVQPWNKLYVVFTSGSTGTPKGTITTHSNFCSAIHHHQANLGLSSFSRVYDFARYSFDMAWSNFIHTMAAGGCLCIPSQSEAINNLAGSIRSFNANFLNITPSVGSMVRASELDGILKHVVFAGEALTNHLAAKWAQHVRVLNLYGPAECTVGVTLHVIELDDASKNSAANTSIGRGLGCCTWIVSSSCHDKLAPVGEVGELLLEGPIVGAGYLCDEKKTAELFIEDPQWLVEGPPGGVGRHGRLYKTGDLVRYEADGRLSFVGRKDSQVKINGQRVELGEIEYHVREHDCGGPDLQVVAELVAPCNGETPLLVAFLQMETPTGNDNGGRQLELHGLVNGLNERLAKCLPAYMIPSAYIPLEILPKNASGKIDRRKLREIWQLPTTKDLVAQIQTSANKSAPITEIGMRLQALWATVLGLPIDDVGAKDSFLRLGGDSISAMKLIEIARGHGLSLSVADVFNHPILDDMSAIVDHVSGEPTSVERYSLLESHIDVSLARHQAAVACGVDVAEVEDIFPCTPLQELMIALTAKHSGDYVSRHVLQLHPKVDTNRLQKAWNQVMAMTPILRTRIIDLSHQGLVQVVISQSPTWTHTDGTTSLEPCGNGEINHAEVLGVFFALTMHHALYDGWSLQLLLERIAETYAGETRAGTSVQFQSFIKHIIDIPLDESSKFWSAQFESFEAQIFPELPSSRYEPRADQLSVHGMTELQWPDIIGVTASTTLQAAWSILTSSYTNADDIVFGVTVSGRQATVRGVDQMIGPTIATVPKRIRLSKRSTVAEFLRQVQMQSISLTRFEQMGLQSIRRVSPEAERACGFQTLLVIQPAADEKEKAVCDGLFVVAGGGELWSQVEDPMAEFRTYPLSLECHLQDNGVVVSARFDSKLLDEGKVVVLMRQFEHVLRRLCDVKSHQKRLEDVSLVGHDDLQQMWRWNWAVPEPAKVAVHELFATTTRQQPEAQAICAWDGNWTYAELDKLSSHLACSLVDSGAMMAVMKAGGASLALDYAQPKDRLRSIVDQELARRLSPHSSVVVVVVSEHCLGRPAERVRKAPTLPEVDPSRTLYLVFTSGSTGRPKGVVVTHENIASAILHQRGTLAFTKDSRIYDFASYMFDVVWCNLLQGLSVGACICIPSNDDRRNDPWGAAARLGANTTILTPSTVRGHDLKPLQCLSNVLFIGEPLSTDDFSGLHSETIVTNLYGPTECTTFSTAQQATSIFPSSLNERIGIGTGQGLCAWLVNPSDHTKLVPLGCVGEVLLEGPLVAAGYLEDEKKTTAAFFHDPPWLLGGCQHHAGRHGRLYKTGDLARFDSDGSLFFLGRKDSQVKINGQRVELGDIEHHIQANVSYHRDLNVVAEVVNPQGSEKAMLIAFIQVSVASESGDIDAQDEFASITAGLQARLLAQLPAYMVPSAFIPLEEIPVTASGKIDRRKIRALGQQLTSKTLPESTSASLTQTRPPSTAAEMTLQGLWSAVLGVETKCISAEDNFLRIGGDSIAAMRLVAAARKQGMSLTVAQVFQHPFLCDLAKLIGDAAISANGDACYHQHQPFSLLHTRKSVKELRQKIASKINILPSQVEDAFPCTPLQEGLLALTAKRPGDYVARFVYPLQPSVDTEHFIRAWEAVVSVSPILRTRIIDLGETRLVQVIVNEPTTWALRGESTSLDAYEITDKTLSTGLGTPMTRFAVIHDTVTDSRFFIWTIHHALYDGWSISLMLDKLNTWPKIDITPSIMVRAAWSMLAAKYTDRPEVIFGVTVSGRQAAVADVEQIVGPTIATVPVRVALHQTGMTVIELLQKLQSQAVEMTAFEQTGLRNIRRVSSDAEIACVYQTLLVVHPAEEEDEARNMSGWFISRRDEYGEDDTNVTEHDTHALTLECTLKRQGLSLRVAYDSNILDIEQVNRLAAQFEHTLRQICMPENASKTLSSIEMVSPHDISDVWLWNGICPTAYSACLHDLIFTSAQRQPDALAVNAWDGDFSYGELDAISTRLAFYLAGLGVKPETIVPLYFEKSKWMPVTMLGVMKAGGASVLMDLSQPKNRLQAIIDQIAPVILLTSSRNKKVAAELTSTPVVAVSGNLVKRLHDSDPVEQLFRTQPWNKAYLIFTSGSTGTPKGAIVTHENVCSAVRYQQLAHGYRADARVYDFASYAFDTAWNNFMHTFTVGACLCIPSEDERRDDLAGSINRFKPSMLDITPSAATALPLATVQSLCTLILGGEILSLWQAEKLSSVVDLKLAYGPCECTPTSTIATVDPKATSDPNIGRGVGIVTWIIDPRDHNALAPIGAIGELVLEGPLVGQGYLGDEERTKAAFIHNPHWLLRGGSGKPGRDGRLYRTGDLVRYNSDGTLAFLGRKDAQVKINGQRVELGEIENHMARHHLIRQSVSLYPQTGPFSKRLVGVLSLRNVLRPSTESLIELDDAQGHSGTEELISTLQILLGEALPSYMVPSTWIVVKSIPLSPSGKLDRKLVHDWLLHMDAKTYARINHMAHTHPPREPKTNSERMLCDACGVILNVTPADINLQTSFISNGGDSISAMRLSSYCRDAHLIVSVAMLLKSKTLAIVASSIVAAESSATRVEQSREELGKAFNLSPMQKWFFAQCPSDFITKADYYCNQGFYVKFNRRVSIKKVSSAIQTIVERHSMLRAQFAEEKGGWVQRIPAPEDSAYHFGYADFQSVKEITAHASKSHQGLDIKRGLVFSADLYTLPTKDQYLILIAHHLVVDLVSWRVILDDLKSVMLGKKLHHGFTFQQWTTLQTDVALSSEIAPDKVLPTQNVHNNHEFWKFTEGTTPNTTSDYIAKDIELDNATTLLLIKDANTAYNTEPVDLILSSIWHAFFRIFPTRRGLTIFNEGHGREPWTPEIDLSRTVGWFTTLSPIYVSRTDGDVASHLARLVKDTRRRLPSNGWAYWVSRHLNEQGIAAFASHSPTMEVQFNYHGQFQQLERPDSLFEVVNFDDEVSAVGPLLPTKKQTEPTLCDYEFLSLDYKGLDELRESKLRHLQEINGSQVDSIYPSSPMVDGILLSQMKGTGSYETSQTWLIKPRQYHKIDIDALQDAWQTVVARHPSLRTVFIDSVDASVAFNSVVLKSLHGDIILLESDSFSLACSMLKGVPKVSYSQAKPAHRLVLATILGDDRVLCKIEMSHAISDGASTSITMNDWARAYSGELDVEELSDVTQQFTRALSLVPKADKISYWKNLQHGMDIILEHHTAAVQAYIEDIRSSLEISLPSYMVPSKWIAVKHIPLNSSGKLNRKQLEAWLENMEKVVLKQFSGSNYIYLFREPKTRIEHVLMDACCRVLNVSASEVNMERSFVANGGDSISAMRLIPQCRAQDVILSVAALLKARSLAEIAKLSSAMVQSGPSQIEDFEQPFLLSPIQQWFFRQSPSDIVNTQSHRCNQSFYVRIHRQVSSKEVGDAVSKVVGQHSMLRARFQQQDGNWTQIVPKMTKARYHFESSTLHSMKELQALASRRQLGLDIERGLVFSADLCRFPSGELYLILIAHHLVIDLVSWRIILDDLETLLTGRVLMESLPFQIWNNLQHQEAKSYKFYQPNVLSTDGVNNDLAFWD